MAKLRIVLAAVAGLLWVGVSTAQADQQTVSTFKVIEHAAAQIDKHDLPYAYGGGHVDGQAPGPGTQEAAGSGYDCSGSVSRVLQVADQIQGRVLMSGEFSSVGKKGPGKITIFYNGGHVLMRIGHRYFGTSSATSSGGPGFFRNPGRGYLSQFSVRHLIGLGKPQTL